MPRHPNPNKHEILEMLAAGTSRRAIADKFGVHPMTVYRIGKQAEQFQTGYGPEPERAAPRGEPGSPLFKEFAKTGIRRFGGRVMDDYDRVFQTVRKRMELYREMGDDPVVAAVLQAIKMTLRRISWRADAGGDTEADKQAAEWLETCMDDIAMSWSDIIDQALGEIQYGFQLAEIVYKIRQGVPEKEITLQEDMQGKGLVVPEGKGYAGSRYDDHKIGWDKWIFIAPESLQPGNEWVFDEHGAVLAFNQMPPPDFETVTIPMLKAINFRTSLEKNNPEGRSILRAMYPAWYFKKNLEEVEGIAAERMGAGFPVIYLGDDVGKGAGALGDIEVFKDIMTQIRVDEQMGFVIPFKKMGTGAPNDKGVYFELVSPPSRGLISFTDIIQRYEQRMSMVGLAQFIHLGMTKIGTQALAAESIDFFTLSVEAWADGLADTLNRQAIERLFRLNKFPGITDIPEVHHEPIMRQSIQQMADYINKLAGASLLTPSIELENFLRRYADIPERQEALPDIISEEVTAGELPTGDTPLAEQTTTPQEQGKAMEAKGAGAAVSTPGTPAVTAAVINKLADEMHAAREALEAEQLPARLIQKAKEKLA